MSSSVERLIGVFMDVFRGKKLDGKIVLDLGCGFGVWGHLLRAINENENFYLIGCDIFKPYLQKLRYHCPYDDLVLCDARNPPFRSSSVNIVIAFEIIEHLDKYDGIKLLSNLEDLCNEQIIISTPYGFYDQSVVRNNKFEQHKSAWSKEDFENAGYIVKPCGFGIDLEDLFRKYHLTNLWRKIAKSIFKVDWAGFMLVATKKIKYKRRRKAN